jgi:hypothetical protein
MTTTDTTSRISYDRAPTELAGAEPAAGWSVARRVGFRFLFAYYLLYDLPAVLGSLPFVGVVGVWISRAARALAIWSGTHVLHLAKPIVIVPTGSGDTMYNYVSNFVTLALAAIAAVVWTLLDRKRVDYRKLYEWLRILVRFTLAFSMFGYGFAKIFPNQFPQPTLERLVEPLGDFSPMGLLWTFMGYSAAYNFFTGMGEALGGFLLCFRRTTTAGALLLMAVLGNVVILNFTYDVPVKIYSANLLLMAIFLAAPDMPRIFNLVVRHRRTEPAEIKPLYATPAMRRASLGFRSLLVAYAVVGNVTSGHARFVSSGPDAPKPPLFGIYDVQSMIRNGQAVPLVITDASIWKRVVFSQFDRASVRSMTDSLTRYTVHVDTIAKTVLLTGRFDTTVKMKLGYTRASNGQLVLAGRVGGDSMVATFKRIDETKYLLMSRRFNWIQEQPFNR